MDRIHESLESKLFFIAPGPNQEPNVTGIADRLNGSVYWGWKMQTQGLMVQRIKKARSFSVDERKGGGGVGGAKSDTASF